MLSTEHVLSSTGKVTTTPAVTTTKQVVESTTVVTEKPEATTTPSTPGKICEEPMDLNDVFGTPTTVIPRVSASSNEPTDNEGRITSDKPWTPTQEDITSDNDAWIQIEFDEPVYIFGLVVRGAGPETGDFVTKVNIDYKLPEDEDFTPVTPSDEEESFPANEDDSTPSTIYFPDTQPVLVTVIRVHPVEWEGDEPAIRVGLLGCYKLVETTTVVQTTTELVTTTKPVVIIDETTAPIAGETTTPGSVISSTPGVEGTTSTVSEVTTVVSTSATKETTASSKLNAKSFVS